MVVVAVARLLSYQEQMVERHRYVLGFSKVEVAEACVDGQSVGRYILLATGRAFVSPTEAVKFSEKFDGLPIQTLFDEKSLTHTNGTWPPRRGAGSLKDQLNAAKTELAALRGNEGSELVAPLGVSKKVTVVAVPDEYAERVIGFLRGLDSSK